MAEATLDEEEAVVVAVAPVEVPVKGDSFGGRSSGVPWWWLWIWQG